MCYVSCFNANDEDFRCIEFPLVFNTNHEANTEITEEETNLIKTYITTLEADMKKVSDLKQEIQEYIYNATTAEETRQENEILRQKAETNRDNTLEEAIENMQNKVTDLTEEYNKNAEEKTTTFNDNVVTKTEAFNTNAETKVNDYNTNAQSKINEYNENAEEMANNITTLQQSVSDIKEEQVIQNNNIENLQAENEEKTQIIAEQKEEIEELREDLNNSMLSGEAEGETITLEDSANQRIKSLKIAGNSEQETGDVLDDEGTIIRFNAKFRLSK